MELFRRTSFFKINASGIESGRLILKKQYIQKPTAIAVIANMSSEITVAADMIDKCT